MKSDRLYFIVSTIAVVWGLMTFAAADASAGTALVSLLGMAAALMLTTGPKGKPAPRWVTSVLALAAMAYSVAAISTGSASLMVLHVARTIAALQIVKVLEARTPRNQAQLLALSGMLTVGSVLTNIGLRMGVMLAVYGPLMLASIMLFQIYSAQRRATAAPMGDDDRSVMDKRAMAGLRSVGILAGLAIAAVASGAFIALPRGLLDERLGAGANNAASVSGFTDHVRLGGEGLITESEAVVMDVQILEHDGDGRGEWKPTQPEVIYMRGAVLDEYEPETGVWRRSKDVAKRDDRKYQNLRSVSRLYKAPKARETYLQVVTVRERSSDHLFALARPAIGGIVFERRVDEFVFNQIDRTFSLPARKGLLTYTVRSEIADDDASPELPAAFPVQEVRSHALAVLQREGLQRDPGVAWTKDDGVIINAFERHLRNNPDYTYSREMVPPAPGRDPIVAFLEDTRQGHCEYFASALAALCRSVGIHARVITGYAGSEYDVQQGAFVVRQSNAHAWVEAMTSPGRWETFDPSPVEGLRYGRPGPTGFRAVWINLNESVRFMWLKWVAGFGVRDQQRIFRIDEGGPLGMINGLKSGLRSLGLMRGDSMPRMTPARLARSLLAGAVTFVAVALVLYGLAWALARLGLIPRMPRLRRRGDRRDFGLYSRMLEALAGAGLAKPESVPPLAYARTLEPIDAETASHVRAIADWHYGARFAGRETGEDSIRPRLEQLRARLATLA